MKLLSSAVALLLLAGCTTVVSRKPSGEGAAPETSADPTSPSDDSDDDATESDEPSDLAGPGDAGKAPSKDGGASTPPGKDAGTSGKTDGGTTTTDAGTSTGAIDRVACTGPASSAGSLNGSTPSVKQGVVITDPGGGLRLVLLPNASAVAVGDLTVALYFTPIPGQLSYSPNGAVGCAVLRATASGWSVVDKTQICDISLSTIQHASVAGTCDGTIAGQYHGVFAGNQVVAGAFVLPSDVAATQITAPSCRPMNSNCASHSDCCSSSCSPVLGVCQ